MKLNNMSKSILNLEDVSIQQDKNLVLECININIKKAEFIYLIGKTGSGKSSLLKSLYGDIKISNGTAKIVGFDLLKLDDKKIPYLRRKLGIIFQDFKLLNEFSIYFNLKFVLKATGWKNINDMNKKIEDVLAKVNMSQSIDKHPFEISGGEKQRIAIARALLNDPEIILADEPTGNLDPDTSVEVMKVLNELNERGHTILMATHDYSLISKFPRKTLKCDKKQVFEVV